MIGHLGLGHLGLGLGAIAIAAGLRCWQPHTAQQTLSVFLISPLLLLTTVAAIIAMGPHGQMVNPLEGWVCYGLAWGSAIAATAIFGQLAWQTQRASRRLHQHSLLAVDGYRARVLETEQLFSAQVGLGQPQLVVSRGLLERLSPEHLQAVLAHEAAHAHYRDTFWFFWLAGLRRLTSWLPHSEVLWQELLLLRELRADRWATQFVDRLVLAEALVEVISAPLSPFLAETCAPVGGAAPSCLARRVEALLAAPDPMPTAGPLQWTQLCFSLVPLLAIPFHH